MNFALVDNPYLVPFDGSFRVSDAVTRPRETPSKKAYKKQLAGWVDRLADLQELLYATDKYAVLLVFQAMDAAGKDSTIRAVMSGVNPAGFQVSSFKVPSKGELDHDFLWRTTKALPQRGRIGVFNRSYYEETLVVRVHPEYLGGQRLPEQPASIWEDRFASIRQHEAHLARNGTVVVKFWLNVSRAEQMNRFMRRIERADKNWKFAAGDLAESRRWDDYMVAYEAVLNATSRPSAPWYAIPADDKPAMRLAVAHVVVETLSRLELEYPRLDPKTQANLEAYRAQIKETLATL